MASNKPSNKPTGKAGDEEAELRRHVESWQTPAVRAIREFVTTVREANERMRRALRSDDAAGLTGAQYHDARKAVRASRKWLELLAGSLPPTPDEAVALIARLDARPE